MATLSTGDKLITLSDSRSLPGYAGVAVSARRSRKISREAGRGIEILGHAIDYLADEFALDCLSSEGRNEAGVHPRVLAIELLMERNREIYFDCPEIPTFGERLR